jgi:hypothetical protein
MRSRLPSPALVVASLALVVALGGTAFAAAKISGSEIKTHSISGNRLKNNTLTGKQIQESKLGKVPSATNADRATKADSATTATTAGTALNATNATNAANATTAGDAATVGGLTVKKVSYTANDAASGTGTATTILNVGGLTLTATCDTNGVIDIEASTAVDNADYQSDIEYQNGTNDDGWTNPDFDSGSANSFDITDARDAGLTTFTYVTPAGAIVNGQLGFEDSNNEGSAIFNGTADCIANGFVTSTASS